MCGRFALRLPVCLAITQFQNDPEAFQRGEIRQNVRHGRNNLNVDDDWIDEDEFVPRYNIAPRTYAPVVRRRDPSSSSDGSASDSEPHYVLQSMKWGLVPHWSKVEDKTLSTTNARSENLVEGGSMWSSIKGKKRCAVICQGYLVLSLNPHFVILKLCGQLL
jgi:putative SOS response-associated peptidase YedK